MMSNTTELRRRNREAEKKVVKALLADLREVRRKHLVIFDDANFDIEDDEKTRRYDRLSGNQHGLSCNRGHIRFSHSLCDE